MKKVLLVLSALSVIGMYSPAMAYVKSTKSTEAIKCGEMKQDDAQEGSSGHQSTSSKVTALSGNDKSDRDE